MTQAPDNLSALDAAHTEIVRLQKLVAHYQAPFKRAERLVQKLRVASTQKGSSLPAEADMIVALVMEQAKSRTFGDAAQAAGATLTNLIDLAHKNVAPDADALQAAQEAVDLIAHLHTLWPTDESQN